MTIEEYAIQYLEREIAILARLPELHSSLSVYEKAIIYKYTDDGFDAINEVLRESKGAKISELGVYLSDILERIPSFEGYGFRGVDLPQSLIQQYIEACEKETIILEFTFVSGSKSATVARQFGNVFFEIYSENWKNIEAISKYSIEKEVILKPNSTFEVLAYKFENGIYHFKMIEI